jgi:hypothetical protein
MKMAQRTVYLSAIERRVTLGDYIKAVKKAKNNLEAEFDHGLDCWCACSGQDIVWQFRRSIHNRINDKIPYIER